MVHGVTSQYLKGYLNQFCYGHDRHFVEKPIPIAQQVVKLGISHDGSFLLMVTY